MTLEAWFEDLLPTKWSRRAALATIVIAGAAFGVPSILPQSYLPESQEEIFLLRIILLLFVALVGTLVVLFLVVREFNLQATSERGIGGPVVENEPEEQLTEAHERVLRLLFDESRTVEEVGQSIGANREQANYYLYDLLERGMVSEPAPYAPGPEEWCISQQGRQFIMRQNER